MLAIALESSASRPQSRRLKPRVRREQESEQLSLRDSAQPLSPACDSHRVAISAEAGKALTVALDDSESAQTPLKQALADESPAEDRTRLQVGDARLQRARNRRSPACSTIPCSTPICSIPTYSTYGLRETAFRKFNLKLGPSPAEAADVTLRLTEKLRDEVEQAGLRKVYDEIDLPLVPVLARMEDAGVKLDCDVLAEMSQRLEREIEAKAREIYDKSGFEFNINSPKQLGDVLFNKLNLPKPIKYGKGKTISTAVDVLEGLAAEHEVPKHGPRLPPALQAEVDLR